MRYVLLLLLATFQTAHADPFERQWPGTEPVDEALGAKIAGRLIDYGNAFFADHVDTLSHDVLTLRIDGDRRAAKVGVGGGNTRYVALRLAGNVAVVDGTAQISSRLAVAIAGKQLDVRLPDVDVASTEYHGERGVEVRLPLVRKAF